MNPDSRDAPISPGTPKSASEPAEPSAAPTDEAVSLELTPALRRALDAAAGRPIRLVDTRTGAAYILLPADEHARLEQAAAALVEARLEAEWLERTHGRSC